MSAALQGLQPQGKAQGGLQDDMGQDEPVPSWGTSECVFAQRPSSSLSCPPRGVSSALVRPTCWWFRTRHARPRPQRCSRLVGAPDWKSPVVAMLRWPGRFFGPSGGTARAVLPVSPVFEGGLCPSPMGPGQRSQATPVLAHFNGNDRDFITKCNVQECQHQLAPQDDSREPEPPGSVSPAFAHCFLGSKQLPGVSVNEEHL